MEFFLQKILGNEIPPLLSVSSKDKGLHPDLETYSNIIKLNHLYNVWLIPLFLGPFDDMELDNIMGTLKSLSLRWE